MDKASLRKLEERYNENDDRSKQGQIRQVTDGGSSFGESSLEGFDKSKGRDVLPTTEVSADGETSNGSRESKQVIDNLYRKLKKR